jgi:hypothetical protein
VHRLSSGLGTWSIQSGTEQTLSGMDLTVCSQPLTFDGTALTKKGAGRTRNPAWIVAAAPVCACVKTFFSRPVARVPRGLTLLDGQ